MGDDGGTQTTGDRRNCGGGQRVRLSNTVRAKGLLHPPAYSVFIHFIVVFAPPSSPLSSYFSDSTVQLIFFTNPRSAPTVIMRPVISCTIGGENSRRLSLHPMISFLFASHIRIAVSQTGRRVLHNPWVYINLDLGLVYTYYKGHPSTIPLCHTSPLSLKQNIA
jgi:hypothetical protein